MIDTLALLMVLAANPDTLLSNGDFSDGLKHWELRGINDGMSVTITDTSTFSSPCLSFAVDGEHEAVQGLAPKDIWPHAVQQVEPGIPGAVYRLSASCRQHVTDGGVGVMVSLSFFNKNGDRIMEKEYRDHVQDETVNVSPIAVAPPGTAKVQASILFNAKGKAWVDDVTLTKLAGPVAEVRSDPVTITVTDEVACDALVGFGAQDNGYFYSKKNVELCNPDHDPADPQHLQDDIDVHENRITFLEMDWVRMFFNNRDWFPETVDGEYRWESSSMKSHYRTLALYQNLGVHVNVSPVEWGMDIKQYYHNPELVAQRVGDLMKHLIKDKGFTCVKSWTISNEPNCWLTQGVFDSFDDWTLIHELVKQRFEQDGLDVKVVGSDDAHGPVWFEKCVKDPRHFAVCDIYAAHSYLDVGQQRIPPYYFDWFLSILETQRPVKPFILAEFGYHDQRTGNNGPGKHHNPAQTEYPYAVWITDYLVHGLNRGLAGANVWTLYDSWYCDDGLAFQDFHGCWGYKNIAGQEDWQIYPAYHAVANICRNSNAGDKVYKCVSDDVHYANASLVSGDNGETLIWVNPSNQPVQIKLKGRTLESVRIMTETNIAGDRLTGEVIQSPNPDGFTAPPMSFGSAEVSP